MKTGLTIFNEPHHQSLEVLAVQALAQGDVAKAFQFADRRCRISPPPEPQSFVLRGEAAFRMGDKAAALSDIMRALDLAPEDIGANRRMVSWIEGPLQLRAAAALAGNERDFEKLRRLMTILRQNGRSAYANVTILDDVIEGWAFWVGDAPLALTITDGTRQTIAMIDPDPSHPLRDRGRAASFRISRPKSSIPQSIVLDIGAEVLSSIRSAGNDVIPTTFPRRANASYRRREIVTVVVPVYNGYDATKACLESLFRASRETTRIILVNDAAPDPQIVEYLAKMASTRRATLLINEINLGFVGSINRALESIVDGDVVLLNADTIVPSGFVDRLAAVARSSADIGTVMPLSNNGDLASFPVPYDVNPLGLLAEIEAIDKIAATVNTGALVDIPNGVGFCLYITRECLDAVGLLSESYHRGYLEDVDFCLRARENGFRNVCTPSVYVGHAGARAFGEQKRSLVVRNLEVLKSRFPTYDIEYAAFSKADPIRKFRAAIERQTCPGSKRIKLIVTGADAVAVVARERARQLASDEHVVIILEVRNRADGPTAKFMDSAGSVPQSIEFALASSQQQVAMFDYLKWLRPSRIEILDARVPLVLVDLLLALDAPYDLFVADAGLFGRATATISQVTVGSGHRSVCLSVDADHATAAREPNDWPPARWREIGDRSERIFVPCEQAKAFAERFLSEQQASKLHLTEGGRHRTLARRGKGAICRLGLVPVRGSAQEHTLMSLIARFFRGARPDVSLIVVGSTLDDLGLMRIGNAYVTGAVGPEDFERLVGTYKLQRLFVALTRPLFGLKVLSLAFNSSIPIAYVDWSMGRFKMRRGDLPLDPDLTVDAIASAISQWMQAV
jgi:O-antigen biosynthesis protein